jgi:hypothetical protein
MLRGGADMYLLADMWHDCFAPEERNPKKGSEYWGLARSMEQKRNLIMSELPEEGRKVFEAFVRAQNTLADLREEDTYIRAFQLGAKMMLDILGEHNSPFQN